MESGNQPAGSITGAGARPRIFVVDDEAIISTTLAAILKLSGFDAVPFTHPIEALQAACLQFPDLLLSDVVMPDLSGIELAIKVQEYCPACKIILISGQSGTSNLIEQAQERGYRFELLPKPMNPQDLIKRLKAEFEFTFDA